MSYPRLVRRLRRLPRPAARGGPPAAHRVRHALRAPRLAGGALLQGAARRDLRPRLLPQRGDLGLRLRRPRQGPLAGQARHDPGLRQAAGRAPVRPGPDRRGSRTSRRAWSARRRRRAASCRPTSGGTRSCRPAGKEKTGYPTQKPEGVLRRVLQPSSRPGDWVLDFFAGSGTTGAVAAAMGRRFVLVDENPQAVDVMRARLPDGDGLRSTSDGRALARLTTARPGAAGDGCARLACWPDAHPRRRRHRLRRLPARPGAAAPRPRGGGRRPPRRRSRTGSRWGDAVDLVRMDAADAAQVRRGDRRASTRSATSCTGCPGRVFRDRDRVAAEHVRDAVDEHGIGRVVYLSGLVPDVPEERAVAAHRLAARGRADPAAEHARRRLSLRAGVVIGAGSTSFEIIRQTASTLLVQPVPLWMHSRVQPIAVADVLRVLADALEGDAVGDADIGGPDVVTYPELLTMYAEAAHLPARPGPGARRPRHGGVAGRGPGVRRAVLDRRGPGPQPAPRHGLPPRAARPGQGRPDRRAAAARGAAPRPCSPTVPAAGPRAASRSDPAWVRVLVGRAVDRRHPAARHAPCSARRCTSPTTASAASSPCSPDPGHSSRRPGSKFLSTGSSPVEPGLRPGRTPGTSWSRWPAAGPGRR